MILFGFPQYFSWSDLSLPRIVKERTRLSTPRWCNEWAVTGAAIWFTIIGNFKVKWTRFNPEDSFENRTHTNYDILSEVSVRMCIRVCGYGADTDNHVPATCSSSASLNCFLWLCFLLVVYVLSSTPHNQYAPCSHPHADEDFKLVFGFLSTFSQA